jgi:hypothetical protein
VEVVTLGAAERNHERKGLSTATCSPHSLLVVESLRRHVRLQNRLQRSNVNANFHGGCDHEHLNAMRSKLISMLRLQSDTLELPLALGGINCLRSEFLATQSEDIGPITVVFKGTCKTAPEKVAMDQLANRSR